MNNKSYTLQLTKDQFDLLDIILFEEWRDYIDCDVDEESSGKYCKEDLETYNSLVEIVKLEKLRKGLDSKWGN